jgi:hypothetical protein
MVEVRRWIVVVAVGWAFSDASCFDLGDGGKPGPSRELDRACRSGRCAVSGAAVLTSGPTSDTVGIQMGPGESSATITLSAMAPDVTWNVQLLVSGSGTFAASDERCAVPEGAPSSTFPVPESYAWVDLGCAHQATATETTVTVATTPGSTMDIADVRTYIPPAYCSIGRRR